MGERGTHVPVLLERCLELLTPALAQPGAVHVDATLGLGGHAEAVLEANPDVTLVGLDRDPQALELAGRRLARFAGRTHLVHAVYDELPEVLDRLSLGPVNGILFDLGVSSLQLDEAARGFAYAQDARLDMRMDQTRGRTAEEVVNTYSAGQLTRILRVYGEERFASRIAAAIVRERTKTPLTSSARLAELVRDAIPAPARRTGGHPAKRTFQALRIEVNEELGALERALPAALDALAPGGRVVLMSYHSLEDRLVKQALVARTRSTAPVDLPVELPGTEPTFRLLTRGAEPPSEAEVEANPRAASVKLRAAERVDPAGPGSGRQGSDDAPTGHKNGGRRPGLQPRPPRRPKAMHQPSAPTANRRAGERNGRSASDQD
ncbi:16S rRNA (cytosine(1402)-N(4))-methyltransferase RsmH [Planosporangium mesophilum]|uniref:Ribosomal RNA small subunit methyltransferase H n=1 Tax=Planosporangium mesophilum TaxID=689768 RepID=A0A8J3TAR2_9ACTN|nr:16S rRNA (cytosine(1402)-N(4))-methyltransferase RsmH [Planosporangium mesophilum]NJC83568.1 16S rRNA (cytosine(1402)-N(4))-methyltransferase RsmH [Planosporangium mesophilum]GII22081.1 ribosomal RNA small subunit methyltransferase H [Planosporangium mesophilum]